MSKTVVMVGVVLAVLVGGCLLCLAAGLVAGEETPSAASAPNEAPDEAPGAPPSQLNGRYACLYLSILIMGSATQVTWQAAAMPPFTIDGDSYESGNGSGSIAVDERVVSFTDGPYDGWRGFLGTDTTGSYVLFDGKEHARVRTNGAKRGDLKCYRQKD